MRRVDQPPWVMSKLALKTLGFSVGDWSSQSGPGSGGGAVYIPKLEDGQWNRHLGNYRSYLPRWEIGNGKR